MDRPPLQEISALEFETFIAGGTQQVNGRITDGRYYQRVQHFAFALAQKDLHLEVGWQILLNSLELGDIDRSFKILPLHHLPVRGQEPGI